MRTRFHRLIAALAFSALLVSSWSRNMTAEARDGAGSFENETKPAIVRLDSRFDELVPRNAQLEKIADGFDWVEGPVWNQKERTLLFSDVPNNSIFRWKDRLGTTLFLKPSGYTGSKPFEGREPGSNGLAFDKDGRLVFCQHGNRSISRLEKDGTQRVLVDRYNGKRINSPNDVVFKSDGTMYFTDPPFGLPKSFDDPARELDFCGVYRLGKDGKLNLLTVEAQAPNGIAFSPDEKTLYISDSRRTLWLAFRVRDDGLLEKGRILFDGTDAGKGKPGVADGMKIDTRGNIFGAAPGGIFVISPDGVLLGRFDFGTATGNCAWGEDGSTLFIASNHAIYRIRLSTRGAGWAD